MPPARVGAAAARCSWEATSLASSGLRGATKLTRRSLGVSEKWLRWVWVCCVRVLRGGAEMQVEPLCRRGAGQLCPSQHCTLRRRGWGDEQGFGGHFLGCGGMVLKSTRRVEGQGTLCLSELFGGTAKKLLPKTAFFPKNSIIW